MFEIGLNRIKTRRRIITYRYLILLFCQLQEMNQSVQNCQPATTLKSCVGRQHTVCMTLLSGIVTNRVSCVELTQRLRNNF